MAEPFPAAELPAIAANEPIEEAVNDAMVVEPAPLNATEEAAPPEPEPNPVVKHHPLLFLKKGDVVIQVIYFTAICSTFTQLTFFFFRPMDIPPFLRLLDPSLLTSAKASRYFLKDQLAEQRSTAKIIRSLSATNIISSRHSYILRSIQSTLSSSGLASDFLTCCCRFPLDREELIGVLAFSHKYVSARGAHAAITGLGYWFIPPSFQLRLAWQFGSMLPDSCNWANDAAAELLGDSLFSLHQSEARDLEIELGTLVSSIRSDILKHRIRIMGFVVEAEHSPACQDRHVCAKNWVPAYTACTRLLANFRDTVATQKVFEKLEKIEIPGMVPKCKEATLNYIGASGVFAQENTIKDEGVQTILGRIKQMGGPVNPVLRRLQRLD
jgi:hypothetical protein